MSVFLGIDVGQKHDPTAVCVAESISGTCGWRFAVRWLERLPLQTPYPEVVERILALVEGLSAREECLDRVYVDATGVGTPVVDLLVGRVAPDRLRAVYLTPGQNRRVSWEGRYWQVRLGKRRLVRRLQALLQGGRLMFPAGYESRALEQELLGYEVRISSNGHDRYGAFRSGAHDDLATAVGLAVQRDPNPEWRSA